MVFPTPVGVFLGDDPCWRLQVCLPHACGGVSAGIDGRGPQSRSSPRLWGCFSALRMESAKGAVFPTPVGVFLLFTVSLVNVIGLPHACGGVS